MGEDILAQLGGVYAALRHHVTWPVVLWSLAILVPTWLVYQILIRPFLSPLRSVSEQFVLRRTYRVVIQTGSFHTKIVLSVLCRRRGMSDQCVVLQIPGLPYKPIVGNMQEIFSGEAMVATIE